MAGTINKTDLKHNLKTQSCRLNNWVRFIQEERMRNVSTADSAMVLLYWEVGRMILVRQARSGWGAKVIERLAMDLRETFPDMKGLSPRNLKYMRAFAAAWPDPTIVQETLAQISWYHNLTLLEKLNDPETRLWYARQTIKHGWPQRVLVQHIRSRLKERLTQQRLSPNSIMSSYQRTAAGYPALQIASMPA